MAFLTVYTKDAKVATDYMADSDGTLVGIVQIEVSDDRAMLSLAVAMGDIEYARRLVDKLWPLRS